MTTFLDSNILIEILKNKKKPVAKKHYVINPIVYAEVLYGLLYIKKKPSEFDEFLGRHNIEILNIQRKTAEIYTTLKLELNRKGSPIEDNDLLVAASCLEYDIPLVTGNVKHFDRIRELKVLETL